LDIFFIYNLNNTFFYRRRQNLSAPCFCLLAFEATYPVQKNMSHPKSRPDFTHRWRISSQPGDGSRAHGRKHRFRKTMPFFRPIRSSHRYLNEIGNPKILFSAQSIRTTEGPEGIGKYTLLLLTAEEARALIRWSTVDRFTGPRRYL